MDSETTDVDAAITDADANLPLNAKLPGNLPGILMPGFFRPDLFSVFLFLLFVQPVFQHAVFINLVYRISVNDQFSFHKNPLFFFLPFFIV